DDAVVRGPAIVQGEVEALEVQRDLEDLAIEDPQRLLEQLLARLVALQHGDTQRFGHGARVRSADLWTSAAGAASPLTATRASGPPSRPASGAPPSAVSSTSSRGSSRVPTGSPAASSPPTPT